MGEKGFRLAGSGFGVKAQRIKNRSAACGNHRSSRFVISSEVEKSFLHTAVENDDVSHLHSGHGFPYTANNKDLSTSLEMTIRGCLYRKAVPQSVEPVKFESRDDEELGAPAFFSYRTLFPSERGAGGDRETNDAAVSLFI